MTADAATWLGLVAAACATVAATGVGALPVLALGRRVEGWTPVLWGTAGGVMVVAAVAGLLVPGVERSGSGPVLTGTVAGAVLLALARRRLRELGDALHLGRLRGAGARRGVLVVATLFAHSLPEGLAVGAAWAADGDVTLLVVAAIALQNVPEGLVAAIPLREAGLSPARVVGWSTLTSAPQVPGALLAFGVVSLGAVVLGVSFGLAAGAMLALVALEIPGATRAAPGRAVLAAALGALATAALAASIG